MIKIHWRDPETGMWLVEVPPARGMVHVELHQIFNELDITQEDCERVFGELKKEES